METENSVIVQLRVLNRRLRKAENRSLSLMQASRSNLFKNEKNSQQKLVRSDSNPRRGSAGGGKEEEEEEDI